MTDSAPNGKAMRRRLFTLLAALSLLLCVATAALWVRSYWRHDQLSILSHGQMWYAYSSNARVIAGWGDLSPADDGLQFESGPIVFPARAAPFSVSSVEIVIAHWLLAIMLSLLPVLWIRASSRERRLRGCCTACGYDLRATPDRCPECGTIPPAKANT